MSVAGGLAELGIGRGDRIAVWLPNGERWTQLALGARALGATVVAINTRFRAHEVQDILTRSQAKALAYEPGFHGIDYDALLAEIDAPALLTGLPDGPEVEDASDPDAPWLIFTSSGTTGAPKLVVHAQRGLDAHATAVARSFGYTEDAAVLCVLPLCGVFGFCTWTGARAGGARTVFEPVFDGERTARLIRDERVTHANLSDEMLKRLLEHDLGGLREVGFAAFNLDARELVDAADAKGITAYQCYGASETQALVAHAPRDAPAERRAIAGGQPISDEITVRVVDDELQVKGPNVMLGYLDDDPPFTADGFYPTGDLGETTEHGFAYRSRRGDALRLNGFLVGPREIESFIESLGVDAAQVVEFDGRPYAFVLGDADEGRIIERCRAELAGFKVPRRVVGLDAFPTTPSANGERVRRSELRRMAQQLAG